MKIDIPYETVDSIVVENLKEQLEQFESYLRINKETEECCKVFDTDRFEDRKLIKKHIKSFKRVLEWYGEKFDG